MIPLRISRDGYNTDAIDVTDTITNSPNSDFDRLAGITCDMIGASIYPAELR